MDQMSNCGEMLLCWPFLFRHCIKIQSVCFDISLLAMDQVHWMKTTLVHSRVQEAKSMADLSDAHH